MSTGNHDMVGGERPTPLAREGYQLTDLDYELRDDGVLYTLDDGTRVKVQGNSPRSVTVSLQKDEAIVPPETGNLGGSKLRNKLVSLARERFGETNGLVEDLESIALMFDEHLRERREAAEEHLRENEIPELAGTPYRISEEGGFVLIKHTREGEVPVQLTNFLARVEEQVVRDDGAEEKHSYEIEACSGGRVRRFEVPAVSFASMGWVARHLGASSYVYPGFGYKDHAAVAIQSLSGEITERRYFAHTGWRKIEGEWAYLHAGGAIGPKGPLSGVEVAMGDGRLGDCLLPEPPEGEALVEAVRASLRFLDLAPPEVAYPLLATVYRAALGEAAPVDLSLHLVGPTGAYKTEITALTQAYYGAAFNGRNLPGNWESTDNSLEKQAFLLKDAALVVDDFAPTGTAGDVA